jgi:hypothetical protein
MYVFSTSDKLEKSYNLPFANCNLDILCVFVGSSKLFSIHETLIFSKYLMLTRGGGGE